MAGFNKENQQGPAAQHGELCSTLCDNLMVTRGKDGGRESQGVWDGHGHAAMFNTENQQGPAGQLRELCSMSGGSLRSNPGLLHCRRILYDLSHQGSPFEWVGSP